MRRSLWRPGDYSRLGIIRRWWHKTALRHSVVGTIVKDVRGRARIEFYYRKGWVCAECRMLWA